MPPSLPGQLPLAISLRDSASFANYYPGLNRQPLAQLRECAAGRGERFMYLWGRAGSGCTHLLQAACREAAGNGLAVVYIPLAQAVDLAPSMLEGLDQQSLVCIDDIQCIAGQREWEAALFHLYNALRDGAGRLAVAGDNAPAGLGLALPDLVSRLSWGLTYQLLPLDDTDKCAALQLRAGRRGLELPAEVAEFLLRRGPRDATALFDLLEHLDQVSLAAQRRLTIPFVRQFLQVRGEE